MNSMLLIAASVIPSFLVGYGLRKLTLKWENKTSSAKEEAALQAEQLEATVTASLDGIIIIDANGKIVEYSESAERIFGYKKIDILGESMAELIVPERYRDAHNNGMQRMRDTGKANILGQRIEIEALRANGEEFMSELAISRSRSSSGDIFIAYIRDISEAKAAEQALRDAKDAAELANKAKTQFISAMSHEIRTPFNAVLGIFDILGETKLTKDQKQLIQTAEKTSQSLLRIINDVLDYARISSGSVKIVKEPFHAPSVFDDVYRLFAMQAKDSNIVLKIIGEGADNIHLSGDQGRIRQILMNFVSNAIKYTRDGTVELIVETQKGDGGAYNLVCKVKDNGRGISKEKQSHLFDEFYMVEDVDTRTTEGTGLGLTICKILTKMMGGTIGVESELGDGATFWVNIPLTQTDDVITPTDSKIPVKSIDGKRILLAEDNATNRMVVSRILEKKGTDLTVASNGVEALSCLNTSAFDLLLTDVFMPEMGGKELVEILRAGNTTNAKIPVIALTAMGDIHEAEELKAYGVDRVILKPFNSKDLIRAIGDECSVYEDGLKYLDDIELNETPLEMKMSGGLIEGLDADDLAAIRGQFEIDLVEVNDALRSAVSDKNIEATQRASHTLKGLAGLYGLTALSEAAALTNSHCSDDTISEMVKHGMRAIKIADIALLRIDDLFDKNEEAA